MQTCQVVKNHPVHNRICLIRDTISQESVGVGVRIFAAISQMPISNFSWHRSGLMITHVMERVKPPFCQFLCNWPIHGLAKASNIHTPFSHVVSLTRFYFFNLVPILCTSVIPIHKPYFIPYMVLNTNITFETNLSILSNIITKFISPNCHARKTSTMWVRFLHILQLIFTQVTQLLGFYFSKKELQWIFNSNKSFLITSPRVLSWQVHLG